MSTNDLVTILSSGMGLGVHIPALLLNYQLQQKGIPTETVVIESYFMDEKEEKLEENKKAFHRSYKVAVLGHKMAQGNVASNLDAARIRTLMEQWRVEKRNKFIMLSGQWATLMSHYIESDGSSDITIDAVHLDAGIAPSWKKFKNEKNAFNEIWMFDNRIKDITCGIFVNNDEVIPYDKRDPDFLIHGGGWGMGTYREKVKELNDNQMQLKIVAYDESEITDQYNSYYLLDPSWKPWKQDGRKNDFPPMYEITRSGEKLPLYAKGYQAIYDVLRKCRGIISKPGGGTLIDSLSSATPIIFLDPIAKHEEINANLWENLGLGISYERWKTMNYSIDILEGIHHNLLVKRKQINNYLDIFLNEKPNPPAMLGRME